MNQTNSSKEINANLVVKTVVSAIKTHVNCARMATSSWTLIQAHVSRVVTLVQPAKMTRNVRLAQPGLNLETRNACSVRAMNSFWEIDAKFVT